MIVYNLTPDPKDIKNFPKDLALLYWCTGAQVGAQSGLGPGPGWGPYGPLWVLLDRSWQVRTCPISDFWSNFACFGFKIGFLTKFLDDSAWFSLEKKMYFD